MKGFVYVYKLYKQYSKPCCLDELVVGQTFLLGVSLMVCFYVILSNIVCHSFLSLTHSQFSKP